MSATSITNAEPVHRWVICFAGFCQDEGENIGVARLWRKLVTRCSGPNSVVLMREWHQPVGDLAGLIAQFNGAPDILICGYSYGGQTAVNLAGALQHRKIGVARA